MFFKKKSAKPEPTLTESQPAVAWDDKTTAHFARSDRFDVQITSMERRFGFGMRRPDEAMREPSGLEVHGVIAFPKLVLVTLSFEPDENFGGWFYHLYNSTASAAGIEKQVPFIEMWISDSDGGIREALYESHKTALLCGRSAFQVRFWKRAGDGVMTEKDREHGYSYESRYPLIGLFTWAHVESAKLPDWAVPYGHDRFSLKNLPPWHEMTF